MAASSTRGCSPFFSANSIVLRVAISLDLKKPATGLGTWPVKGFPAHPDRSPAYVGGILGRSGPNYGEDTQRVISSVLGMTAEQVAELNAAGVV